MRFLRFIGNVPAFKSSSLSSHIQLVRIMKPSFDVQDLCDFSKCVKDLSSAASIRCILITGRMGFFSAGLSKKSIEKLKFGQPDELKKIKRAWHELWSIKVPLVAASDGITFGLGFEILLLCDIAIASERSTFAFPEVKLGIIPGFGGTQLLPKLLSKSQCSSMLMCGEVISSSQALQYGIISKRVSHVIQTSTLICESICESDINAIQSIKNLEKNSHKQSLFDGIDEEHAEFGSLLSNIKK